MTEADMLAALAEKGRRLGDLADRINELITRRQEDLKATGVGIKAEVNVATRVGVAEVDHDCGSMGDVRFGFGKVKGSWCLYVRYCDQQVPLLSSCRELRFRCMDSYQRLLTEINKRAAELLGEAKNEAASGA